MGEAFALLEGLLLAAAFGAVRVSLAPGVPVAVQFLDDSLRLVCCAEPAGVAILDGHSWRPGIMEGHFGEPEGIAWTPRGAVICDRSENCVWTGFPGPLERVSVPGGPFSAVALESRDTGGAQIAVALRDAGAVAILDNGSLRILAELPGARDLAAADMDLDGDLDLLAACCGGALYLIRNGAEDPEAETIGTLDGGVKGAVAADLDGDGLPDAAGIPCARGGAQWWRNPGDRSTPWRRSRLTPAVSGAKDIAVRDGRILVAALFSPSAIYSSGDAVLLPGRCTACCWGPDGSPVLGHRSGLIMEFRPAPSP